MKHLFSIIALVVFGAFAVSAQEAVKGPKMEFKITTVDYGTIEKGADPHREFKFTNVGQVPLTILKARSSCGCTVPEWPEEPIPPGGSGEIFAKFNTEGKMNNQTKTITITANTYPNDTRIKLTGIVTPQKDSKE